MRQISRESKNEKKMIKNVLVDLQLVCIVWFYLAQKSIRDGFVSVFKAYVFYSNICSFSILISIFAIFPLFFHLTLSSTDTTKVNEHQMPEMKAFKEKERKRATENVCVCLRARRSLVVQHTSKHSKRDLNFRKWVRIVVSNEM